MVEIVYFFLPQCGQFEKHGKNKRKQKKTNLASK